MKSLSLYVKPVSGRCNMRCSYCLFADGAGSGRAPDLGAMSMETLEAVVGKALSEAEESCNFAFVGGEPTLAGLDFFRRLVEMEDRLNRNGVAVSHALSTNGLLINDEWAAFLAKYNFVTTVSIDADKKVHSALRPDAQGKDTHNRAVLAVRHLAEHGAEHNIATVLTRALAAHPDRTYRYYKDRNFRHVHFIPCLAAPDEDAAPYALGDEDYGRFLRRVFDLWYNDFAQGEYLSIRFFDSCVHALAGHAPAGGVGEIDPLVEADGTVYPCDPNAGSTPALGNVREDSFAGMLESDAAKGFSAELTARRERFDAGGYGDILRNGGHWIDPVLDAVLPLENYAEAYRTFFDHAKPRLEFLAKRLFADETPPSQ